MVNGLKSPADCEDDIPFQDGGRQLVLTHSGVRTFRGSMLLYCTHGRVHPVPDGLWSV